MTHILSNKSFIADCKKMFMSIEGSYVHFLFADFQSNVSNAIESTGKIKYQNYSCFVKSKNDTNLHSKMHASS